MSDYTLTDLRADMAATIKDLRNNAPNMTVEKAREIGNLGSRMIESGKLEVDLLRVVGHGRGPGRVVPTPFLALEHQDTLDEQTGKSSVPALEDQRRPKPHIRNPVGSGPRGSL